MSALPDGLWGEIGRFVDQPEFVKVQIALARTSKQLYGVFGGYRFIPAEGGSAALEAALVEGGEAKAIVLLPGASGLSVTQVPTCTSPEGGPTPIVSYGDTAVTDGVLHVKVAVRITAAGNAQVWAQDGAVVEASEKAQVTAYIGSVVEASGNASITAYPGSVVEASGSARVNAYNRSRVEAWGDARVKAFDGSTVIGEGAGVVIYWTGAGATVSGDAGTLRVVSEADLDSLDFEQLEVAYPGVDWADQAPHLTDFGALPADEVDHPLRHRDTDTDGASD